MSPFIFCRNSGEPTVEVEYQDKTVQKIQTSELKVQQILDMVESRALEMETAEILKRGGFEGEKLYSNWNASRSKRDIGYAEKIPRQ